MAISVDLRGVEADILIRQGVDTCSFVWTFTDLATGAAIDVSGYTFAGGVYKVSDRSLVTPWVYDLTDAAIGVIRFAIDAAHTAPLATVDSVEPAAYVHSQTFVDDQGGKAALLYGDFRVIWGTGE
ncbi:MAG TPA: hypothetical protein VFM34_11835 [Moraxellaceae bacterium]|nr:hypothetical protein [Moraxellaceae bacterium]